MTASHRIGLVLVLAALLVGGCEEKYYQLRGAEDGLVVILPGIQGVDEHAYNIESGLVRGGVRRAIVIQKWGKPMPEAGLGMLLNQIDKVGARFEAMAVAQRIVDYQGRHPGKPVHIVGHSGGGAIAVFVAESVSDLPGGEPLEGLVLISPSISPIYDLQKALNACNQGIMNCYNPDDTMLLGVGTTVMGNIDGVPGEGAGLNGFDVVEGMASQEKIELYDRKLFQELITGYGDPHFAGTNPAFVSRIPAEFIRGPVVRANR